jgi:hypothetical protein
LVVFRSGGVMRRLRLLYPFLFAIQPVLTVVTRNPGGSTLLDVATLMAVVLAACAVAYALVAVVSRGHGASPVVSLIMIVGIAWFYAYEALRSFYHLVQGGHAPLVLTAAVVVMLLALATAAGVWWLARRSAPLRRSFFRATGGAPIRLSHPGECGAHSPQSLLQGWYSTRSG